MQLITVLIYLFNFSLLDLLKFILYYVQFENSFKILFYNKSEQATFNLSPSWQKGTSQNGCKVSGYMALPVLD